MAHVVLIKLRVFAHLAPNKKKTGKKKKTKVCEACGMLFWFGKSSIYDWNFPIKF